MTNFGSCVVVRSVCVSIRYSFVERAGPTLRASVFLCMHENVRRARRIHVSQKDARHTQSTLDQRQAHAEHALGIRCMFVG
ncbi:hypothetical protein EYF80_011673 [Liparis tanakae]|uniref:Uncharacterized protein n=1 Tax=Liparis tanakae TaxID=230148 RepID=A0A4Z2IK21_9TELE|nr:hypothetical protein EYF80_011673 [Liparis tanakae]